MEENPIVYTLSDKQKTKDPKESRIEDANVLSLTIKA